MFCGYRLICISNGKEKPIECPKKQNVLHIQSTCEVVQDINYKLQINKLTNKDIQNTLKKYSNSNKICDSKEV